MFIFIRKNHFRRNFKQVQLFLRAKPVKTLNTLFLFQVQTLKVLVNLSSNPDIMDDIVQAQVRIMNASPFFFFYPSYFVRVKIH